MRNIYKSYKDDARRKLSKLNRVAASSNYSAMLKKTEFYVINSSTVMWSINST